MRKGICTYIGVSLAIISLLSLGLAVDNAAAREKITLKGGTPWGKTHASSVGMLFFAKRLNEISHGDLTMKTYFAGALVTGKTQISALKNKIVDAATLVPGYFPGAVSEVARVSQTVPFAVDFVSLNWMLKYSKWYGIDYYFADVGMDLHPLFPFYGEQVIMLAEPLGDIMNPSLKGRKLRSAGLGYTEWIRCLGGDTIAMPSPEIPAALATGIISGVNTSLDTWEVLGIEERTPYVYIYPAPYGIREHMLESRYQSLPDWAKKVIDQAAEETSQFQLIKALNYRQYLLDKFKDHPKVKMTVLKPEQQDAWVKTIKPFYDWVYKTYDPEISNYMKECKEAWIATHTMPPPAAIR